MIEIIGTIVGPRITLETWRPLTQAPPIQPPPTPPIQPPPTPPIQPPPIPLTNVEPSPSPAETEVPIPPTVTVSPMPETPIPTTVETPPTPAVPSVAEKNFLERFFEWLRKRPVYLPRKELPP